MHLVCRRLFHTALEEAKQGRLGVLQWVSCEVTVPLNLKSKADLRHHLLEQYKNQKGAASPLIPLCFDVICSAL